MNTHRQGRGSDYRGSPRRSHGCLQLQGGLVAIAMASATRRQSCQIATRTSETQASAAVSSAGSGSSDAARCPRPASVSWSCWSTAARSLGAPGVPWSRGRRGCRRHLAGRRAVTAVGRAARTAARVADRSGRTVAPLTPRCCAQAAAGAESHARARARGRRPRAPVGGWKEMGEGGGEWKEMGEGSAE